MSDTLSKEYEVVDQIDAVGSTTMDIHPTANVHPQAIVEPGAKVGERVDIGPWCYVGADVEIGAGTQIRSHVVLKGPTTIGRNNRIFQFSSVGEECQDKKYADEPTRLIIGDNNTIREGCTLHRGTIQDQGITAIGNNNLLMAYVHVAHDCVIGDNCILANNVALAGHVIVGNHAIIGGYTTVHQFCQIGEFSMSAANTAIFKDVPAFVTISGNPASPHGMNVEGMRRRGYSPALINKLRQCYKVIYRQGSRTVEAIEQLEAMEPLPEIQLLIDSLKSATRGITR